MENYKESVGIFQGNSGIMVGNHGNIP
jgi:hypothetical protein